MLRLLIVILMLSLSGCGTGLPDAARVKRAMSSEQLSVGDPIVNRIGMTFVPIPAGEFQMGTAPPKPVEGEQSPQPEKSETPQRLVKITKPFYIGICEVTQEQYAKVMSAHPWKGQPLVREGATYPATYVTWNDAVEFCKKMSELENATYRLPTEAEWEYACRAGTNSTFSFGEEWKKLGEYAWFDQNAYKAKQQYAHRVGLKRPNLWVLYDMHGNAWEWCQDWYAGYGVKQEVVDPTGPDKGRFHVWRGGGFADSVVNARSATRVSFGRADYRPEFMSGFRVVRTVEVK